MLLIINQSKQSIVFYIEVQTADFECVSTELCTLAIQSVTLGEMVFIQN